MLGLLHRVHGLPSSLISSISLPRACLLAVCCVAAVLAQPATAQLQITSGAEELQTVKQAQDALDQFGGLQIESIPPAMLGRAEGVAIFPNMIKGGFILGVNYGKGVLMVRRPDRSWSPPVMVTMGGGSVGFQAGVQAADIVLVFATPRSLQGIMNGQKVTLGADASIALGPVGRQANAGTDAKLGAEIYSYARSRGLFLGVSLGGADLSVDHNANAMLYSRFGVTPADVFDGRGLAFHQEVKNLIDDMNQRTQGNPQQVPAPTAAGQPQAVQPVNAQPAPVQPVNAQPVPVQTPPLQSPAQQSYAPQTPARQATVPIQPVAPAQPAAVPPAAPAQQAPPLVPIRQ
jgi:lipid-binding SYLF domain-containing protein